MSKGLKLTVSVLVLFIVLCISGCNNQYTMKDFLWDAEIFFKNCEELIVTPSEETKVERELEYKSKMKNLLDTNNYFTLSEVFDDFDWDYAFILKETCGGDELDEILGVDINIPKADYWVCRIVFMKEDKLAYVFSCNVKEIHESSQGTIVHPEDKLGAFLYSDVDTYTDIYIVGEKEYY